MDFKEQSVKLPIENFDAVVEHDKRAKRHGDLLPDSIRAIFCGPSNCGNTNSLLALITHPNGVRFENVYVYSKSLNQPKYKFLNEILEPIEGVQYFSLSEHDAVVDPDHTLPNSIMIFDDISCEKQDNVRAFFCMGRHKNVDCFYLCQTYAHVHKLLVRDNVNLLVIFRQDEVNLKHIYDDYVNTDMTYIQFKELCSKCSRDDKYSFLVLHKDREINDGRFRKGFDNFAINYSIHIDDNQQFLTGR